MSTTGRRPSHATAARQLLRESLLDVAREFVIARGWSATRLGDVAAAVGVSRPTLYKQFANKSELAAALVDREVDRFLSAVDLALSEHPDDAVSGIRAAASLLLSATSDDVFAKSVLLGVGSEELLPLVTTQGQPVLQRATELVAPYLMRCRQQLPQARAVLLADTVVRLMLSHVLAPALPREQAADGVAEVAIAFLSDPGFSGARDRGDTPSDHPSHDHPAHREERS